MLLAGYVLAGCTIEVGPPPESDPPLVSETTNAPPPPAQPSEPQPWSRGLDLQSVPVAADRNQMTEGLVAGDVQSSYSGERLTFESAFDPEKPPSQAELMRQQARQRAIAAGLPPPPRVAAAPVAEVDSQALPPEGGAAPPPPKFPQQQAQPAATAHGEVASAAAALETDAGSPAETAPARQSSAEEAWAKRQSRLPAPPAFPSVSPAEAAVSPEAAETAEAEETQGTPAPAVPDRVGADQIASAAAFAAEAWDAPTGTILVQVAAVPDGSQVTEEWQRLRTLFPQVLKPLRLVVDEARLGERGVFYRVQAGGFGSQEGAAEACDSLISRGQACFVVVR